MAFSVFEKINKSAFIKRIKSSAGGLSYKGPDVAFALNEEFLKMPALECVLSFFKHFSFFEG